MHTPEHTPERAPITDGLAPYTNEVQRPPKAKRSLIALAILAALAVAALGIAIAPVVGRVAWWTCVLALPLLLLEAMAREVWRGIRRLMRRGE